MKILLHSLLCLLVITSIASAASPVVVPPASHVGGYEALLYETDEATGTPAGFISLTVATTGKFTGKLTTDENKTYPFTGTFLYDAGSDIATTTPALITISRGKVLSALSLSLALKNNGQTLEAAVTTSLQPNRVATNGVKITPRPKTQAADWAGKYTLAFTPSGTVTTGPSGSSYAGGVVDAAGTLKIAGKLADGTTLTATLLPDANRGYRTYLNVLKRPGSYFAGKISLVARSGEPGFHVVTATAPAADFFWNKPALGATKDKAYPGGFGPLKLLLTMEPWVLPAKGQTLANLLGITTTGGSFQFDFDISGAGLNLAQYLGTLPKKLTLDAKNALVPVFGDVYAPSIASEWAKIWTGKVDPNTGIYTGTLTLSDLLDPDGPINGDPKTLAKDAGFKQEAIKLIKRKVTYQGVLFNTADALKPLAAGNFLLPPIDAKTQTTLGGAVEIPDAPELLGTGSGVPAAGAVSPGTPGTYEVSPLNEFFSFDWSSLGIDGFGATVTGKRSGIPANGSKATFSIAPDLSSITFNGRKVPLVGDSRPVALVFSDATAKNYKNMLTVIVYLNTSTGVASSVFASYIQLLSARYTVSVPGYGTRTVNAFVPSITYFDGNPAPVKIK